MNPADDFQRKVAEAIAHPKNMGEMEAADAVGTVGSPGCGDMVRLWVKFKEDQGRKVIDRATFQTFGCETAIAVASLATELIRGKTPEEALQLSGQQLAADLGPLPPMKIHCGQLVEGALRSALTQPSSSKPAPPAPTTAPAASGNLIESLTSSDRKPARIVFLDPGTP